MENKRPLILISNDDGYQAKGINSLIDMVVPLGDILVCAPDGPRSGFSCAFSATTPLRLTQQRKETGIEVWSSNGTPVDCVKLALARLTDRTPDIVIGGINHGDNGSVNSHYSGTMGVVMEGCMKYIPSVAFSLCDYNPDADFEPLRPYIVDITRRILEEGLPKGVCLNVNFPFLLRTPEIDTPASPSSAPLGPSCPSMPSPCDGSHAFPRLNAYHGVRVCRMAQGSWLNEVTTCHHPRGYDYHWMVGHYRNDEPEATDTDHWALDNGYVAITPTTFDVTAYEAMCQIEDWHL